MGMNRGLWSLSAVELAAMIRAREVSCVEAMESVLGRIAVHNGRINAIVNDCSEEALRAAGQKDREVAGGAALGPLHGVPVTIKENVDVTGQATTNGLPAFADLIAPDDSPVVRNLLDAGAIIVGRTNTPSSPCAGPRTTRFGAEPSIRGMTRRRPAAPPVAHRPPRRWGSDRSTTETTSADRCASLRSRAESRR